MPKEDERPTGDQVETETEVTTDPPVAEETETEEDTPAEGEVAEIEETQRTVEEADGELEIEKKRTAYLQRQLDKKPKATEPEEVQPAVDLADPEPQEGEDRFPDYSDWVKEHHAWSMRKAAFDQKVEEKRAIFRKKLDPGFVKYKDFAEVALDKDMPKAVRDALYETENPADIAYFLGKNPSEARRISYMNPIAVAREIGRLEVELAKPPKKKPSVSSAPEVIDTMTDTHSEAAVVDEATLTRKERFAKWERERLKRAGVR
jgi:hypothetical protein